MGRVNNAKMFHYNLIYRLYVISIKLPASYFINNNKKTDSKVYTERKKFNQHNTANEKQTEQSFYPISRLTTKLQ